MGFLSEFLHPTRWYSKILVLLLILAFFSVMAIGALSGFLLYRVVSPVPSRSQLDFSDFPGHPEEVTYQVPGEGSRTGWFFPGLRQAPTVLLCPGYRPAEGSCSPWRPRYKINSSTFSCSISPRGAAARKLRLWATGRCWNCARRLTPWRNGTTWTRAASG